MEEKQNIKEKNKKENWKENVCTRGKDNNCTNPPIIYGLGFIGALIYYITTSSGFVNILIGFLKALVWPAFLIFELFKYLGL
ncbi:MAG: hypothetical protein ACOC16_02245 [Nanoarchaeota archaeon]